MSDSNIIEYYSSNLDTGELIEEDNKSDSSSEETIICKIGSEKLTTFNQKHPLAHPWTLWFLENNRSKNWEDNLKEVITVDTVEDFWCVYINIKSASTLEQGCDYSLFKKGIRPMWEDLQNKNGGRWIISIDKKQRKACLDYYWLEVLLFLIGEDFEECAETNGCVVNIRNRIDKVSVWTANAYDSESVLSIGKILKERLKLMPSQYIAYECHFDSMNKGHRVPKVSYIL